MEKQLVARVKAYNEELKQVTAEASNIAARISYTEEDLTRRCKELSALLGIEVTVDNLESIYEREIDKVENNLKVGEDILRRIREGQVLDEEAENISKGNVAATPSPAPVQQAVESLGIARRQSSTQENTNQTAVANNNDTQVPPSVAASKTISPFMQPITPQTMREIQTAEPQTSVPPAQQPVQQPIQEPISRRVSKPVSTQAPNISTLMGGTQIFDV